MYNKGLACQKYLFKLLEEYVPVSNLTQFVKKIPD